MRSLGAPHDHLCRDGRILNEMSKTGRFRPELAGRVCRRQVHAGREAGHNTKRSLQVSPLPGGNYRKLLKRNKKRCLENTKPKCNYTVTNIAKVKRESNVKLSSKFAFVESVAKKAIGGLLPKNTGRTPTSWAK
jgi:hypothetical protein